jgi:amino acid transporter
MVLKKYQFLQALFIAQFACAAFLGYQSGSSLIRVLKNYPVDDVANGYVITVLALAYSIVFALLSIVGLIVLRGVDVANDE